MCGSEFVIVTDMSGHGDFACGCLCTDYFAFALKGPNDLNAEVNFYRCITMGGMMVEEAIMPVDSQALMATEELPDEIKRWLPDAANVSTERAPPHRGERLCADGFRDNLTIHRGSLFTLSIWTTKAVERLTGRRESIQPSPRHSSYKTRSRGSRPTICYVSLK
jgi:hypothetical protein